MGILRTNGLPVETAEGDMVGVYPTVSRFNHSCNNNVDASGTRLDTFPTLNLLSPRFWALSSGYRRILAQSGAHGIYNVQCSSSPFAGNFGAEHRFATTALIQYGQQSCAVMEKIKE